MLRHADGDVMIDEGDVTGVRCVDLGGEDGEKVDKALNLRFVSRPGTTEGSFTKWKAVRHLERVATHTVLVHSSMGACADTTGPPRPLAACCSPLHTVLICTGSESLAVDRPAAQAR